MHKELEELRNNCSSLLFLLRHPNELEVTWQNSVAELRQHIAEDWLVQTKELILDIAERQMRR